MNGYKYSLRCFYKQSNEDNLTIYQVQKSFDEKAAYDRRREQQQQQQQLKAAYAASTAHQVEPNQVQLNDPLLSLAADDDQPGPKRVCIETKDNDLTQPDFRHRGQIRARCQAASTAA